MLERLPLRLDFEKQEQRKREREQQKQSGAEQNSTDVERNPANHKTSNHNKPETNLNTLSPAAPPSTPKKIQLDYSCWPEQPSEQVMTDWLAMRKRLKANVSQTVINRFAIELHKARTFGYTVDQCLAECVTRNWRGFEVQWMQNSKQPAGQQYKTAAEKEAERNAYTFDLERARIF